MSSYVQNGNSITVPKGSTIRYTITLDGFETKTGTIFADATKTVTIALDDLGYKILTINTPTENAKIEFEVVNEDGLYHYTGSEELTFANE